MHLEVCKEPKKHHVFFDNFFASYKLVNELNKIGFSATGTMRENLSMKCPVMRVAEVKKNERGFYDYRSSGNISGVMWNNNSVVTLCSNAIGVHPIRNAKHWIRGKGQVNFFQPAMVGIYNSRMARVDLADRALSKYRSKFRGKKWYWPLLVNAVNLGMVFCWRLYQISNKNITQKDYIHTIVHILTKRSTTTFRADARPSPSYTLPAEVRKDNPDHLPIQGDVRKCIVFKKNCRIRCQKCNKSLHINTCFQIFHEE